MVSVRAVQSAAHRMRRTWGTRRGKIALVGGGLLAAGGLYWLISRKAGGGKEPTMTGVPQEDLDLFGEITAKFEGDYWTMAKDAEWEGWHDKPKRPSGASKNLHPSERHTLPGYKPHRCSKYNGSEPCHIGLSFGFIQFTQDGGNLGPLIKAMYEKNPAKFKSIFGSHWKELLDVTNRKGKKSTHPDSGSHTGYAKYSPRVDTVGGTHIWKGEWIARFTAAGKDPEFQQVQRDMAIKLYFIPMLKKSAIPYNFKSQKSLAILFDRSVNAGPSGTAKMVKRELGDKMDWPEKKRWEWLNQKSWMSHRVGKIMADPRVSWDKTYKLRV